MKTPISTRRIVAVRFEDGSEHEVDDADLARYLEARALEAAFPRSSARELRNLLSALVQVQREDTSKTNRKSSKKPRHPFAQLADAKQRLLKIKKHWERNNPTRGWKKAARTEFDIKIGVLNRVLKQL